MRQALATTFLVGALVAVDPFAAAADNVTEQIDEARRLYEEGDVAGAVTELEFAIQEMRAKLGERYLATLPDPPEGWDAEPAEQQTAGGFMGGGTMIGRTYRQQNGEGSIEAQLIVDNPMIQGFAAMFGNPALLGAQPNTQRVRIGRDNAILQWDPAEKSGELTLVTGRAMVQLSGHGLETSDAMVDLLKGWDLDTVKELAGG